MSFQFTVSPLILTVLWFIAELTFNRDILYILDLFFVAAEKLKLRRNQQSSMINDFSS